MPSSTHHVGFAGVVTALEFAGHDELASKLTPDADPVAIEEVRRALVEAREPHRTKLNRLDFALESLARWTEEYRRSRCACGERGTLETREGVFCGACVVTGGRPRRGGGRGSA